MKKLYSISFKNKCFVQDVHVFKLHCFPWWIFQYVSQSPGIVSMTRCSHTFYSKVCQEYNWRGQICNMVEIVWEFLISVLFIGSQFQISSRKDLSSIKTSLPEHHAENKYVGSRGNGNSSKAPQYLHRSLRNLHSLMSINIWNYC